MAYFNYDRKQAAIEDIATCYECAEAAGMKKELFINFGLLLGIIREKDFIGGDDDVDMCVHSDNVTIEQQKEYMNALDKKGMFFARKRKARRKDTGKILWFTLRRKEERAKFCHWWGFKWHGFWWWSKGSRWVKPNKFNLLKWGCEPSDEAIALGMPVANMKKLMWIKFKGIDVQIPAKYGAVLDWEYPGWPIPQGGSSRKQTVCVIPKWDNPRLWRVKSSAVL